MATNLDLGKVSGTLLVKLVRGDTFAIALAYADAGVESAWPIEPVMTLAGQNYTMTLSTDGLLATLVIPPEEVDAILATGNKKAELNLGTFETWRGRIMAT